MVKDNRGNFDFMKEGSGYNPRKPAASSEIHKESWLSRLKAIWMQDIVLLDPQF